ncbi:MAG: glycerol-3-phosphate acyltransferase [Desulfobacteraceae bacterium]|nr:glycerol-3-phosphate acyltransferase [Desulfobacteraceae bacterium]
MSIYIKLKNLVRDTRKKLRNYIDCLLANSYDYYTCFYPGNSGIIPNKLIKGVIKKIHIDEPNQAKLKDINPGNIVVFASKNKRSFDFLFYHTKLKCMDLPYPSIGFDFIFFFLLPVKHLFRILLCHLDYFFHNFKFKDAYSSGYITRQLMEKKSGFVCLIEEDDFYKRFIKSTVDPLHHLIELQKTIDQDIIIVPEDIIYITKPAHNIPSFFDIFLGTNEKPGLIKRILSVLRQPEKISVQLAKPVNLKEFILRPEIERLDSEFQTHRLRLYLVDILNRQRKSITGPVLKSRQEITEDILTRKSLREYMADYAAKHNMPLYKVHKKAAGYIREIAANYNQTFINLGDVILTWLFKNIFEDLVVDPQEINRMREKAKEAPLVLVPCHKSHLDYLLIPYVMFKNSMPCPHIAAGKNLSFWPLGPLFRRAGAFFIRRTFKGAELYPKIFDAYLEKLLFEGFNIKIFIEGGRSRTGKLLTTRPGGLAMLINAYNNNACDDLHFVPIFVGYDRVLEEDAYLKEISGGKKDPETLKGLISARKFLKKKYGKVYLKFDEPISIKKYLGSKNFDIQKSSNQEYIELVKNFGYKLLNRINTCAVVTPHGIIASAVLNCHTNSFSQRQLQDRVNTYMNLLTFKNAGMSDTLLIDPDNSLNMVIHNFLSRNFIELADEDEEEITDNTTFIVKNNKRAILDYYKNSVISFFVDSAYTAVAILETDRFQFSSSDLVRRCRFLQKMFLDEFSFNEEETIEELISNAIKGFINEGIIVPDKQQPDIYKLTSQGLRKLKWFAAFLQPFLESYNTTLLYFKKHPEGKHDLKEQVKKIQSMGSKQYKKNNILFKESLSPINYRNAVRFFVRNKVKGRDDTLEIDYYRTIIERLIRLIIS